MTANRSPQVSDLGTLRELGSGGQGKVFSTEKSLDKPRLKLVYKEYNPTLSGQINSSALATMPRYLKSLSPPDSSNLLAHTSWPCSIVENAGSVSGFLMPEIPSAFKVKMRFASGEREVFGEFQHLLNDDDYLARRNLLISDRIRYDLLIAAATSLDFLHSHRIHVGDLSPKNLLFSIAPKPDVYFIDCDAMNFQGTSVNPQAETPGWEVRKVNPGEPLATPESDRYKFGLLALRLLSGDQTTRNINKLPQSVAKDVVKLIKTSLDANPLKRPPIKDWNAVLVSAAQKASAKTIQPRTSNTVGVPPSSASMPSQPHTQRGGSLAGRVQSPASSSPTTRSAGLPNSGQVGTLKKSWSRLVLPIALTISCLAVILPWGGYWTQNGGFETSCVIGALLIGVSALKFPRVALILWGGMAVVTIGSSCTAVGLSTGTAVAIVGMAGLLATYFLPIQNRTALWALLLTSFVLEVWGFGPLSLALFPLFLRPAEAGIGAGLSVMGNLVAGLLESLHPNDLVAGGGRFFVATGTLPYPDVIKRWFQWLISPGMGSDFGSSLNAIAPNWLFRPPHVLFLLIAVGIAVGATFFRTFVSKKWCREAGVWAVLVLFPLALLLAFMLKAILHLPQSGWSATELSGQLGLIVALVAISALAELLSLRFRHRSLAWMR